jgi:hypothetical protein
MIFFNGDKKQNFWTILNAQVPAKVRMETIKAFPSMPTTAFTTNPPGLCQQTKALVASEAYQYQDSCRQAIQCQKIQVVQ